MSDPTPTPAPGPDAGPDAEVPPPEAQAVPVAEAELAAVRREAQEWKERCVRLQADFDNARKRLRREADEAGTRALARGMKPVLVEIDNLDRALQAARPEAFGEFAQGVAMIRENLRAGLIGQGLEAVPCEGIFDPAVHEVLAEQEDGAVPKGTILQVHRAGWRLRDQLVCAAQVVVARPPAAPAP